MSAMKMASKIETEIKKEVSRSLLVASSPSLSVVNFIPFESKNRVQMQRS